MVMGAMVKRLSVLALACSLAGCSLLLDNGQFVGDGDSGARPRDAGPDAMQPPDAGPDAPSTPVVSIGPDPARTLDDLVASIDTESTDPLDRGAIRYEYRWLVDGADASNESATVSNDATAKDQTWRVEVTPVTTDDRRGVPGSAEVVIQNTAPTLQTVGLSSYRPISGQRLLALPGRATDPDGDPTTIRYRWLANGSPLPQTGSSLPLSDTVGEAGTELSVEARAFDGSEESPVVEAGPAVLQPTGLRWLQRWPDRGNVEFISYDPRHERVLLGVARTDRTAHQLWEHDLRSDRFVLLRPSGTELDRNLDLPSAGIYDPDQGRFFFFPNRAGSRSLRILELTTARRGQEAWREIPLSGEVPMSDSAGLGAAFDPERNVLIIGGADEGGTTAEILEIDLTGETGVGRRVATGQPASVLTTDWIHVPEAREIYTFGGGDDLMTMSPSNLIHRLRLDDLAAGFQELTARIPEAGLAFAGHPNGAGTQILFGNGFSGSGYADGHWLFDVASGSVDPITAVEPRLENRAFGIVMGDTSNDRFLVFPGKVGFFSFGEYQLFGVSEDGATIEDVHAYGTQVPAPLLGAVGMNDAETIRFFGGLDRNEETNSEVWEANVISGREFTGFSRATTTPDPSEGRPEGRSGISVTYNGGVFGFYGGQSSTGAVIDGPTWIFRRGDWIARELRSGVSAPPPRVDAAFFDGSCIGDLGVFGGRIAGVATDSLSFMDCDAGDTGCEWSEPPTTGTAPGPRVSAAVFVPTMRDLVIVGGEVGGSPRMDAFLADTCATPLTWSELTLTGDVPEPRAGHSISSQGRAYMFGGEASGGDYLADIHQLELVGSELRFTALSPAPDGDFSPEGRTSHMAILVADSAGTTRLFVVGGWRGTVGFGGGDRVLGDVWELLIPAG